MTTIPRVLFVAAALAFALAQDPAAEDTAKSRIRAALDATGLTYEASASGRSYVIRFAHEGGRQQTVYLAVEPSTPSGLRVYSIDTTVWGREDEVPDDELVERLFTRAKKLGSFHLFTDDKGSHAIRFGARFDATDLGDEPKQGDVLVQRLKALVEFVDAVGEETDRELNGDRDHR